MEKNTDLSRSTNKSLLKEFLSESFGKQSEQIPKRHAKELSNSAFIAEKTSC